jgi:hypothetical protein
MKVASIKIIDENIINTFILFMDEGLIVIFAHL